MYGLHRGKLCADRVDDRQIVRVLFKTEDEAAAFASEFGGSLLSLAGTDVAIA